MNTIVSIQIALLRAKMVAKRDFHRALGYLLGASIAFEVAVRFVLAAAA